MYETIGSPVQLGNVTLKNRIVFAPTTLGVPNDVWSGSKKSLPAAVV